MRYLTIILSFLSVSLSAQITQDSLLQQLRAVVVVISSTNVDTNEYNIVVNTFQEPTNLYDISDIQPGDWLWTLSSVSGQACNRFEINTITNTGIGEYTLNVFNPDQTGVNGNAQVGVGNPIFRHSPNRDYPLFIASQPTLSGYINPDIQTCVTTHFILAVDQDIASVKDSSVISSVTNNGDGTYTHDDGFGNTTVIDTRANSNPIADALDIYVSNTVEGALQEVPKLGCVTIDQNAHGFDTLNMVTFTGGAYALAMTDTSIHIPVGIVTDVFTVNQFRMCFEGKIKYQHGLVDNKDYFLQDDGSVDTIPDADIHVFAFRTFGANEVAFDVSEYIIVGQFGASDNWGSQVVVTDESLTGDGTAGDPLSVVYDKDWANSGGHTPFDLSENIYTDGFVAIGSIPRPHRLFVSLASGGNDVRFGDSNKENDLNFVKDINGVWIKNGNDFSSSYAGIKFNGSALSTAPTNGFLAFYSGGVQTMRLFGGRLVLDNVPDYASDAAANADSGLITGSVYTVNAEDQTLRLKR